MEKIRFLACHPDFKQNGQIPVVVGQWRVRYNTVEMMG